ncbi:small nuclear ribonucleo protein E [Conidiobolus coronatus NRRL 28638]|uniref:Small nuclear ribonucleoprotein E n=1 Tax=Conidiobolus coronatus (strain ATCC 28846 / CBS 209.66 / NRRL 28638) TaxID=796925 RepID=A0A137P490_CONC2|nr:small nuclear ribonucleo protein E [Conidiobolus coronatus NRRL 28638]|eukprot:KXN69741.1 small nuclear ribonucleo protein E [Conidiobolus coronatus NRRL 28638]
MNSSHKVQKIMVQPINLIFKFFQSQKRVSIWVFDQTNCHIEGQIIGFDEFMNLVLDKACEVKFKNGKEPKITKIGRILLKGDNITLISPVTESQ